MRTTPLLYYQMSWYRVNGHVVGYYEDEHMRRLTSWYSYCVFPFDLDKDGKPQWRYKRNVE
jgi:hypothetical protein